MRRFIYIILLFALTGAAAFAQPDRREVRKGNRSFRKGEYAEADISYRKALIKDSTSLAANYNLASNLYRQEQFDEAGKYLEKVKDTAPLTKYGADYFYNVGDVALQKKDYKTAVEAFAQSLILRPEDIDAKENYIYAKLMMQNQGQGGDNNQDQNKDNQDQNQQDQNQDQQNQDQNKDNQDQNQGQQPQPSEGQEISPQQAQQILEAIQAREKETQDKVNKEKAAVLKSRQKEKNW